MRTRLPFLSRRRGLTTLLGMPGLEACFDAQIPSSVNPDSVGRVAQWNDLTGKGRHLLQGTAASQPIYLPWSGQNYGYCPGVAGNYFSTPDSAAVSVTGDIDLRAEISLPSWTPASLVTVIGKFEAGQNTFLFDVDSTGVLRFVYSTSGGAPAGIHSSTVATGFTANARRWIRVTRSSSTGSIIFYTSTDGVTYSQLGTAIAGAAGAMFDSIARVELGSALVGTVQNLAGSIYYAEIRNGIDGTVVAGIDFARAVDGATTATGLGGETWTVNTSGGKPAQIVGRASVLFDGVDDSLRSGSFTLNQPETIYFVGKQVSWTLMDNFFDGLTYDTMGLAQYNTTSPNLSIYAGSAVENSQLAIGAAGVVSCVFNGASSLISVNRLNPVSGNSGAANGGGINLGSQNAVNRFANIQCSAVAIFATAHDARTRARVIDYLIRKYSIPV